MTVKVLLSDLIIIKDANDILEKLVCNGQLVLKQLVASLELIKDVALLGL